MKKMLLCEYCIEELKSRGEKIRVEHLEYSIEDAEQLEIGCEWCDEYDDLYLVTLF